MNSPENSPESVELLPATSKVLEYLKEGSPDKGFDKLVAFANEQGVIVEEHPDKELKENRGVILKDKETGDLRINLYTKDRDRQDGLLEPYDKLYELHHELNFALAAKKALTEEQLASQIPELIKADILFLDNILDDSTGASYKKARKLSRGTMQVDLKAGKLIEVDSLENDRILRKLTTDDVDGSAKLREARRLLEKLK